MLSVWRKPAKVYLSRVWGKFSDVYKTEIPVEFELRLLDNEWKDKCLELIDVFIKDDPLLKALDLSSDSTSVASLKVLIQQYLAQEIALGCFLMTPGSTELVAIDVIHVRTNNDRLCDVTEDCGEAYKRLINMLQSANKRVNIFKHYGVLKFLASFGIITDPEYKTDLMVERILETRKLISTALHIDVVAVIITNESLEKLAERSEYEVLAELSNKDYQDDDIFIKNKNLNCDIKVMGFFIN